MQMNRISFYSVPRTVSIPSVLLMIVASIVLPLTGCSDSGGGSPMISSLTPPPESQSGEAPQTDPHSLTANAATEKNSGPSEIPSASEPANTDTGGGPLEEEPTVSVTSTPSGATARLTWDKSIDPTVVGYNVYYGKKSSGEHGSCTYEESQSVEAPPATIAGLDPNTPYFFAISAYGGEAESISESPCSNEVIVVTPAVAS